MSDIRLGIDPYRQASFAFRNRLARALWSIVYRCLFLPSPRPFHGWRIFLLRLFGAKIAGGCRVYPRVRIWAPWNLVMHSQASMADDVICYSMATVELGRRSVVSQGSHLCTGTHDHEDPNFQLVARPIHIGESAWVCADAFVGPGVRIGASAVIGARSVVTHDMPEWMVCAGNPCKPLKLRTIRTS